MTATYIPGYLAEITIGVDDLTIIGQVVSFSDDAAAVPKPVFGKQNRNTVRGQKVVSIEASGHLAAEFVSILWNLNASPLAQIYEIQVGEGTGATDGGKFSGTAVITNLTFDSDAEGNWAWSMSLEGDGEPSLTEPV